MKNPATKILCFMLIACLFGDASSIKFNQAEFEDNVLKADNFSLSQKHSFGSKYLRRNQEHHQRDRKKLIYFVPEEFKALELEYVVDDILENSPEKLIMHLKLNKSLKFRYKNNKIREELKVIIECHSDKELSVRVTDVEEKIFELPHRQPFPFQKEENQSWNWKLKKIYEFEAASVGEVFFFKIKRKSTGEVIFDSAGFDFVFSDKYLEITTSMNGERIYGLGDRRYTSFEFNSGQFSFWTFDATRIDYGLPGQQIYGHHPMYLRKESKDIFFHTVLFRNTYGMQADYVKNKTLTFKVIGGNIDFRFFLGDSNPETAVKLYHRYVNGYTLHPFWVQGFHQSRWGYNTTQKVRKVWDNYNNLALPIDSLWSDIDYLNDFQDFTFNTETLSLNLFHKIFDLSTSNGLHWSSIIDVGIAENSNAGQRGVEQDVFIKSNFTKQPLVGWVWPGRSYFPDFNHPNASKFWEEGLRNITKLYHLEQGGIWIDMNEFSNFVQGEILPDGSNDPPTKDYPYNPCGNENQLSTSTLSLSATHYSKSDAALFSFGDYQITEYDMHNINGFSEGYTTYKAAKNMGKVLPFILSRSTLFGSGQFVQHWTGDNMSTWEYLQLSISLIQSFQLFSIPMVGADICGFNGDTNPELCARWHQVGSLYPFSRNHNSINNIDQEPYAFPDYDFVLNSTLKALQVRYSLLKFYYHLFVRGNGTGTVFRPLFFEFPEDSKSYDITNQFMLGEYLMAAPVLQQGDNATNITLHTIQFPQNTIFYDFYTFEPQLADSKTLAVPFDALCPLFILSGKIVHIQDQNYYVRSRELNNEFALYIALDQDQQSLGQILSIKNLNSEENVQAKCIQQNCVMDIKANLTKTTTGNYVIRLEFQGSTPQSVVEQFKIYKLVIMGIRHNGQIESKVLNLSKSWIVRSGSKKFRETFKLNQDHEE